MLACLHSQLHNHRLCMVSSCVTQAKGYGAPELVTCGRDGCVRVWDVRQPDAPVAAFEPSDPSNIRWVGGWVLGFG